MRMGWKMVNGLKETGYNILGFYSYINIFQGFKILEIIQSGENLFIFIPSFFSDENQFARYSRIFHRIEKYKPLQEVQGLNIVFTSQFVIHCFFFNCQVRIKEENQIQTLLLKGRADLQVALIIKKLWGILDFLNTDRPFQQLKNILSFPIVKSQEVLR